MRNRIGNTSINYKLEYNKYPALIEDAMPLDGFNSVLIYSSTINYINHNIGKRL